MARYRGPRDKTATLTSFVRQFLEKNPRQWFTAQEITPNVLHVAERFRIQPDKMTASVVGVLKHLAERETIGKHVFPTLKASHYRRWTVYIYPKEAARDVPLPPDARGTNTGDAQVHGLHQGHGESGPAEVR